MEILYQRMEGAKVVEVQDSRIDAASAVEFKRQMLALMDDSSEHLILDLKNVKYIDSSGLGAIVGVFKMLAQQASFSIVGLTKAVERMFHLTRMDRVFNIHTTVDEVI